MTTKKTWTEDEYEAAGKRSIHLRLERDAHRALTWLSNKLGIGRAQLVEELVLEKELRELRKTK